jgi:hypothetical protein
MAHDLYDLKYKDLKDLKPLDISTLDISKCN